MGMRVLVDMNLPPAWVDFLRRFGIEAQHWSGTGAATATDREIALWAEANAYVVLTHDLDFGAILAATQARAPSIIQLRTQDVMPETCGADVARALLENVRALEAGAILTVDLDRARIRLLPLGME
jgi:predicted nuclease of predicted toxin-antitoxin system